MSLNIPDNYGMPKASHGATSPISKAMEPLESMGAPAKGGFIMKLSEMMEESFAGMPTVDTLVSIEQARSASYAQTAQQTKSMASSSLD